MGSGEREPLTFVTVAFESELTLLLLQARSFAVHVDPTLVDSILVIDNTTRGMRPTFIRELLAEYMTFADRVHIFSPRMISALPASIGWRKQQVLKLAIAKFVTTDQYVVLDAKNHFVGRPSVTFFRDDRGRACGTSYTYANHPLRPGLEHVLRYEGLEPAPYLHRFTATVTPFVFDTAKVNELIKDVESTSGHTFAAEFIEQDLLEFFLYTAWLIANGHRLDDYFCLDRVSCPTVWPRGASLAKVTAAMNEGKEFGAPVFSVHRKALATLDDPALTALGELWMTSGLFSTMAEVSQFLARFRAQFVREERRRKIREIRVRGIRRLARAIRSHGSGE